MTGPFPYRNIPERFENSFFLDSLIQYIIDQGHELILLTTDSRIEKDIDITTNRITLHVCKIAKHGNLRAAIGFRSEIAKLKSYIRKQDAIKHIDVMHAHWCYEQAAACVSIDTDRTIVTMHDWPDVVCPMFHNYYWKRRQRLGNYVITKAKYFSAVSPYMQDLVKKVRGDAETKMIPNSISLKSIKNDAKEMQSKKYILGVNNGFSQRKNVSATIKAFQIIHQSYPELELYLCGDDYEEKGLANHWCDQNGVLVEGIKFFGKRNQSDLASLYKNATMFVHASLEESFGLILLESMKYGCPIVAGKDSGAVPWVLEQGKDGMLVDVSSVQDLVKGMECMLDNNTRENYVQAGFKRVHDFDENIVIPRYLEYYDEIVRRV